ncbi:MAG: aldehyde-activating protein [Myxococcota bacterium]
MDVEALEGSCVCGAVRYRARVDLSSGTMRCNCTSCTKWGRWSVRAPVDAVAIVAGEDVVALSAPNPYGVTRSCPKCGIKLFSYVEAPEAGGPCVNVNVRTLDGVDLHGVPVTWLDGRHDTWAPLGTAPHQVPEPLRVTAP